MAYQMSLHDVETGDTFDLQLSTINEGAIITQGYVPPSPSVNAQTLQPHSPTAMPGRHEATRSYLTESMPLVIQGRDTEHVQEIARDIEWFCERANTGKEVYLRRADLVTSTTILRSRILVGELALDQGSEFQLHAGHPRVQFRLQLTRDAWWEGASGTAETGILKQWQWVKHNLQFPHVGAPSSASDRSRCTGNSA